MSFFGLITVSAHKKAMASQLEADKRSRGREAASSVELRKLEDRLYEAERTIKRQSTRLNELRKEIEQLTPDAEKWRARKKQDRDAAAKRREARAANKAASK